MLISQQISNYQLSIKSFAAEAAPTTDHHLVGVPGNRRGHNGVVQGRKNQPQMLISQQISNYQLSIKSFAADNIRYGRTGRRQLLQQKPL